MKQKLIHAATGTYWFLLITCSLFFLLRFPSLFEPYWYGDEGIYQTIGLALDRGRLLYSQIWDNKPPLLYFFYALLQADQFSIRLVSLIFGIGAILVFFFLAKHLLGHIRATYISTGIFAFLFAIPLLEGNIANAENFILLPIIAAGLLIYNTVFSSHTSRGLPTSSDMTQGVKSRSTQLMIAGLLLGITFLVKIVAIFDFLAFLFFLFLLFFPERVSKNVLKKYFISFYSLIIPYIFGFLLPFLLICFFFLLQGTLIPFFQSTFSQNIEYVAYKNMLLIPQGLLVVKFIVLCIFLSCIFLTRKYWSTKTLFFVIWLGFSLFNAFFSERAYTHYILVFLTVFSLGIGFLFVKAKERMLLTIMMLLATILVLIHFPLYGVGKTFGYYQNFFSFIQNQESVSSYQNFFDPETPQNYDVADFIKSHTNAKDTIFVWGDNPEIYVLSGKIPPGRYVAAYHITHTSQILETAKDIREKKPKYIIILSQDEPFPFDIANYRYILSLKETNIYERLY